MVSGGALHSLGSETETSEQTTERNLIGFREGASGDQDKTVVRNLYKQMKGWNRNLKTDPRLEELAQSLGCVRTHADHNGSRQDREAGSLNNNLSAVIACVGGCPAHGSSNWSRSKPAQIWYEFRHKTGHYDAIMANDRMGCSAKKSGNKICTFCYLYTARD